LVCKTESIDELQQTRELLLKNGYTIETHVLKLLGPPPGNSKLNIMSSVPHEVIKTYLKLENCQVSGSFKMRGVANAFHRLFLKEGSAIAALGDEVEGGHNNTMKKLKFNSNNPSINVSQTMKS
jgi:hypothetical protein